jgi:hypothetical protein
MFEEKLPEYLILIEKDADATGYLREVEKAFDKIYNRTNDMEIKLAIMNLLTNAQLNATCVNGNLHRFLEKNMRG